MKRLFITTDIKKIESMYNRTGHEARKEKATQHFSQLPKEYTYNNDLQIIVLKDDFTDWGSYNINMEADYILYHRTSSQSVIDKLQIAFATYKDGQHVLNELHDQVYRILFDDNEDDKPAKILQVYGFDPEEESLTDAIFAAIYDKKSEGEIETIIKTRDVHLLNKFNRR